MWKSHIPITAQIGSHTFDKLMPALFDNFIHGAAISATTAGRMPLNMASTVGLFSN